MERIGMSNQDMAKFIGDGKIQVIPHFKTLRDEIAIAALPLAEKWADSGVSMKNIVKLAYQWADAMLEARKSSSTE